MRPPVLPASLVCVVAASLTVYNVIDVLLWVNMFNPSMNRYFQFANYFKVESFESVNKNGNIQGVHNELENRETGQLSVVRRRDPIVQPRGQGNCEARVPYLQLGANLELESYTLK